MRVLPLAVAAMAAATMLLLTGVAHGGGAQPTVSASQLVKRFRAATGSRLLVDKRATYAGHYTALALPGSISNQGRYGRFTLYVVGAGNRAEDVTGLLADAHTGQLGKPGPSQIYWEGGRYLSGERYWLAKKQYGANVVLWWYGSRQKIDKAFQRLHVPLKSATAG
jgi:hypothetical protein